PSTASCFNLRWRSPAPPTPRTGGDRLGLQRVSISDGDRRLLRLGPRTARRAVPKCFNLRWRSPAPPTQAILADGMVNVSFNLRWRSPAPPTPYAEFK